MAEGPYIGRQAAQSITGGAYGENTELTQLQTAPGVPLAATETGAMGGGMGPMISAPAMPSRNFATPNPNVDQEITFGAGFGAGPGNEVLPIAPSAPDETATLIRQLIALYPDPDLVRLGQRLDYEKR
jgi:hypothetical protein